PIPPERDPVEFVESQLDRLLQALGPASMAARLGPWTPPMQVAESPEEIRIAIDVPGVPRDAIEVTVSHHLLVVSGARALDLQGPGWRVHGAETPAGPFRRVIALPVTADAGQMTAHLRDGVLELHIPRGASGRADSKVITVQ
ncbi:MAG TPA: Hsp20/alpha crystallin family protein, partial [Kofleriaceae bacterium]|nr:Hsp20/alpha crystallin family protein [Kofleriaceae bacterium]